MHITRGSAPGANVKERIYCYRNDWRRGSGYPQAPSYDLPSVGACPLRPLSAEHFERDHACPLGGLLQAELFSIIRLAWLVHKLPLGTQDVVDAYRRMHDCRRR